MFLKCGTTPSGPKINQCHLAPVGRQRQRPACEIFFIKSWEFLSYGQSGWNFWIRLRCNLCIQSCQG